MCLGRFLHVCPRLNKVAIGELLGEPDAFYLKVYCVIEQAHTPISCQLISSLRFDADPSVLIHTF